MSAQPQQHLAAQYQVAPPLDYTGLVLSAAMQPEHAASADQQYHGSHYGSGYGNGSGSYQQHAPQAFSPTSLSGSFHGSQSSFAAQPLSTTSTAKSVRQHNPYANSPASEPLSPATPIASTSFASADGGSYYQQPSAYQQHEQQHGQQQQQLGGGYMQHHGQNHGQQQSQQQQQGQQHDAHAHPVAFSVNEQFEQVKGNVCATACSHRGRYVLISALRLNSVEKTQAIFDEIVPQLVSVVADQHGCHVVRTMVEFLNEAQVTAFVGSLTRDLILNLATTSQHTRRILQVLFERHRCAALQSVVDVVSDNCVALATTQQGCIAVMRVLENAVDQQKIQLLTALSPRLAALAMDPYGNYVVQSIAQHFNKDTGSEVIAKAFAGHWVALSRNKFASNVMEKVLHAATPPTRKAILDNLIFDSDNLQQIMSDGFGNFVLQAIIDTCVTAAEFRRISDKIRPQLSSSPFAHKIEAKLKTKRFGNGPATANGNSNNNNRSSSNSSSSSVPTPRTATTPRQEA